MSGRSGLLPRRRQDRVAQVVRSGAEGSCDGDHGRPLGEETEAARPRPWAEETAQGRLLCPLPAREGRAVRALAEMGAQLRALGPGELAIELLRDRELGARARERALELLSQRTPCPEDERLDRAHRYAEHLGDLGVRAPFDFAQDDRRPLVEREVAECALDVLRLRAVVLLDERVGDVVVELHLLRTSRVRAEPLQADVVRDRDEPVEGRSRVLAALERPEGVHECRLGDVLRVRGVAEHAVRVAVDMRRVPPVQAIEGSVQARGDRHAHLDTRFPGKPALRQELWRGACDSGCGWPGRARRGRPP